MRKYVYHSCPEDKSNQEGFVDVFFDLESEKWLLKLEEEMYFPECVPIEIKYCPICGAKMTSNNEEILKAKINYHEDKIEESKREIERLRKQIRRLNPPVVRYDEPINTEGATIIVEEDK